MDTGDDKVAKRARSFGYSLALLSALALTACAVPLNKEDLAAYKKQQAERTATQSAAQPAPRRRVLSASSSGATAVPAPVQTAPVETAPVTGVTREALSPAPAPQNDRQERQAGGGRPVAQKLGQAPIHVVAAGETVYAISRKFGVEPKMVIAHNGLLAPYRLSVGQEIKIPQSVGEPHAVAKGETVYGISRLHGVPLRQLIDANGLVPPYRLAIGQELVVPRGRQHQVAKGETVYSIARRYEIDLSELVRLNQIKPPYTIKLAQTLVLPGQRGPAPVAQETAAPASGGSGLVKSAQASLPPAAIPKPPPRAGRTFLWPVSGPVILGYGPKKDGRHNDGINIAAPRGTPIRAAENGVVAYAGNELRGFGNLLLVKHAGGWVTAYAHTEGINVRRGDTVKRGQTIGQVGSSGSVAEPQLHFEVRKGTRAVNPSKLLGPRTANSQ